MDNYDICAATHEDIEQILSLYNDNRGGAADWDEDYPSMETIQFDMDREALFVMKNGDEVVATISLDDDKEVEELDFWNPDFSPVGEVSRLCVKNDYRGQGIAKQMMIYACEEWKRRGKVAVHILVRKGHVVALHTYSSLGFVTVGECNLHDKDFDCMEIDLANF